MANEKRTIEADALKKYIFGIADMHNTDYLSVDMVVDAIDNAPAVEVVHGRWHDIYQVSSWCSTGHCSACEEVAILPIRGLGTPYCPNCGAQMDGERKDNGTSEIG